VVDSGQNMCYSVDTNKKGQKSMPMLTGEYFHQLDAKNRIRIPSKLKKELGEEYYFAKGTNGCIAVFPKEKAESILNQLQETKLADLEQQKGLRSFAKSFVAGEEDNQGRVVLNPVLKDFAKIKKDIVICGAISRVEIWAKEVYDEYFSDEKEDYDSLFARLDI
jgi:MraZ protein